MIGTFGVTLGGILLEPQDFFPYLPFFIVRYWRTPYDSVEIEIENCRLNSTDKIILPSNEVKDSRMYTHRYSIYDGIRGALNLAFNETFEMRQIPPVTSILDIERWLAMYKDGDLDAALECTDICLTHMEHYCMLLSRLWLISHGYIQPCPGTINLIRLLRRSLEIEYTDILGQPLIHDTSIPIPPNLVYGVEEIIVNHFRPFQAPSFEELTSIRQWRVGDVIYSDHIPVFGGHQLRSQ